MPAMKSRLACLVLCWTVGGIAASDSPAREVGWILEYGPPKAVHAIHRRSTSQLIDVAAGTLLYTGDVVNVRGKGRILVALADGSEHEISGGSWTVPAIESRLALWSVIKRVMGLTEMQGRFAGSAVTKGGSCVSSGESEPLSIPALSQQQSVVSGPQKLPVEWRGGCGPFFVQLQSGGSEVASGEAAESGRFLSLYAVLKPGALVVHIRDADGKEIREAIDVVEAAPLVPTNLAASSATLRLLAEAKWLSEQDGGRWRLESVKRLEPLVAEEQPIAMQLASALLRDSP